jgi:hypothetical protein
MKHKQNSHRNRYEGYTWAQWHELPLTNPDLVAIAFEGTTYQKQKLTIRYTLTTLWKHLTTLAPCYPGKASRWFQRNRFLVRVWICLSCQCLNQHHSLGNIWPHNKAYFPGKKGWDPLVLSHLYHQEAISLTEWQNNLLQIQLRGNTLQRLGAIPRTHYTH